MNPIAQKKLVDVSKDLFFYALAIASFLWVAFFNRYPIVYPDAGAYINSGFSSIVPGDRPIMYGFLLRHISLAYSLWFVVFFQSMIGVYLVRQTLCVLQIDRQAYWLFIICLIISLTTTCGYYIGQIMPDIFSAYMWLALVLLLVLQKKTRTTKILLYSIVVVSSITHFSNLLSLLVFSVVLFFFFLWKKDKANIRQMVIIPVLSILVAVTINFAFEKKVFLSKTPHVFFTAKLCNTGLLKDYLSENCDTKSYRLCAYKDELPATLEGFLWGDLSIIEKIRLTNHLSYDSACMLVNDDFGRMNKDILFNTKYGSRYLGIWFNASARQLVRFDADPLPPFLEGSTLYPMITWHYKADVGMYRKSRQSLGTMDFSSLNTIQNYVVLFAVLYLLFYTIVAIRNKFNFSSSLQFAWLFVLAYLINILVCEFFSTVANRFSGRMIWILPLIVLIDLVGKLRASKRNSNSVD